MNISIGRIAAAGAAILAVNAQASCGSAFCLTNTNWESQGFFTGAGTRVDLRYEFVRQDALRSGTTRVSPSEEPGKEAELKTINRNVFVTVDHSFDRQWALSLQVPFIDRFHAHNVNEDEGRVRETWNFHRMGDVRVVGRYQFRDGDDKSSSMGIRFGAKLPTGSRDITNDDGARAERSLQPGTGTTDVILGAYFFGTIDPQSSWFAQVNALAATNSREEFKPGETIGVDFGYRRSLREGLDVLIQFNASRKGRDKGAQAEPDDSGGTFVSISPGLSLTVSPSIRLYTFLQLPVYQRVNGTQLTTRWSGVAGVNFAF